MTRVVAYGVLIAVAAVVQTAWLTRASVAGAVADPLLSVVMVIGFLHGAEAGALAGAAVGLVQDLVTGVPLGLGMLGNLSVGFLAGLGERTLYFENLWLPALAALLLTVVRSAVWMGAAHLVGLLNAPPAELAGVTLLTACYNGAIAVPIFHGLRRLDRALIRLAERS